MQAGFLPEDQGLEHDSLQRLDREKGERHDPELCPEFAGVREHKDLGNGERGDGTHEGDDGEHRIEQPEEERHPDAGDPEDEKQDSPVDDTDGDLAAEEGGVGAMDSAERSEDSLPERGGEPRLELLPPGVHAAQEKEEVDGD